MTKRLPLPTETELARLVVDWFTDQHWDVYQEVQLSTGGPIADIVATHGPRVCVVECKLSLGLRVIDQAHYWSQYSHLAYVAVPTVIRRTRDFDFACYVAGLFGLGVLVVTPGPDTNHWNNQVSEYRRPELRRRAAAHRLRAGLSDQHKTFAAAGNPNGKRWTPFQKTCLAVAQYVSIHPGCSLKQLIDNIDTHYGTPSTARNCIRSYAERGIIPGVRVEYLGRAARLYPEVN